MPYYATYQEFHDEIAIFATETERDAWVEFKDQFSKDLNADSETPFFHRRAITESEAAEYSDGRIYDRSEYIDDVYNDNMKWVAAPGTPYWEV